jgi:hypothetical protein
MLNIDLWNGNKLEEIEELDYSFYTNPVEIRGNLYIRGEAVGDFSTDDSSELIALMNYIN